MNPRQRGSYAGSHILKALQPPLELLESARTR